MERKRELTSVDLAAVVGELQGYAGAKVDKAYLYGDDFVRLKLRDYERGRIELLIEVGEVKRAHVASPAHVPDAPDRPPNFAKMLRNRLSSAELVDVSQFEFDRILTFTFDRPDGRTQLVAELFGQGNVAVLDELETVVDSLHTVRLRSRTVAPGSQYEYPSSRVDPLSVDRETFSAVMAESDTDVVRTLATQLNFGGLYGEELCTRAGVEKTRSIDEATPDDFDALYDAIRELADRIRNRRYDPRIYLEDEEYVDVTPFPLEEYSDLDAERYDRFNEALDTYFHRLETADESASEARPDFTEQIERKRRIIEQQESAIDEFDEEAEIERARAEALYANYGLVDDILSTVRTAREQGHSWDDIESTLREAADRGVDAAAAVVDVDGSRGRITVSIDGDRIELDVRHGVEKNADRIYTNAKRVEEKKEGALAAIEETREELAALEAEREAWNASEPSDDESEEAAPDEPDWLERPSIPVRTSEEWYERFRWFHSSDGFLIIGGRNADQNEELVKKYLDRGDRFFHAQAHGGPATILKATGPSEPAREVTFPDETLREAAQFAVSYSSVWKDGQFAGDVYAVRPDQVSKTPESGEYLGKGGFVIRGERTYYHDVEVGIAIGITCAPSTRVIGGPPSAIDDRAVTTIRVEPGRFAQEDVAKRIYRTFRERFEDTTFVRKIASPDLIQLFLPPGRSRIVDQ